MITYKSYYNIAPTSLCKLISRRESSVITQLKADHHQLIMPPISKDCSNTLLDRSFIYAAPYKWNKLSECIRTLNFDSFRKSVKTMFFYRTIWRLTENNVYIIVNGSYCFYSPVNSYLYIHWILDFKYILCVLNVI